MTTRGAARLLRNPDAPKRATLLELFFDVVYVAAFALASLRLASDVSWSGVGETLVLLAAIWWTWSITALLTDFYNPTRTPIQAIVVIAMLGAVLMAASIPSAYTSHAMVFAGAYVGIHLLRGIVLVSALRGHQAQIRAARFFFWFGISGIAWLVGASIENPVRVTLWAIAIMIDLVVGGLRYPTPWLGRVPLEQYSKATPHLGERYQQVIILGLGELILVPTLRFSTTDFDRASVIAFLATFATTLLLWQLYVYQAGVTLQAAERRAPGRTTRWAAYTHFVMVTGVVATAAGAELVIGRPEGDTPIGWAGVILGGSALFLIGRMTFQYQLFPTIRWVRVGGLIAVVLVAPLTMVLAPMFVVLVVDAVLLATVLIDMLRTSKKLRRRSADQAR